MFHRRKKKQIILHIFLCVNYSYQRTVLELEILYVCAISNTSQQLKSSAYRKYVEKQLKYCANGCVSCANGCLEEEGEKGGRNERHTILHQASDEWDGQNMHFHGPP